MEIFYLFFFMNFCLSYVSSGTLPTNGNKVIFEPKAELQMMLKQKNEDNITWTKFELNSSRGILTGQDGNNSGQENTFIPKTSTELPQHQEKEASDGEATVEKVTESQVGNTEPLATEHMFAGNNSRKDSVDLFGNHSQDIGSSEFSDALNIGNLSSPVILELESGNISDAVVVSFSDLNTEVTVSETLIESLNSIEQFNSKSTLVISEEGDAVLFQEVPTFGFEFLIDSETTRNSLLSEMLNSTNILIAEDAIDEFSTLFIDWEQSTSENVNFMVDKESDSNSSFHEDILKSETKDLDSIKSKMNTSDLNLIGSEQNEISETITPVCPEPGWCFFWFFAQDTCAEDIHCLGPRICCKLGCSKTCFDV